MKKIASNDNKKFHIVYNSPVVLSFAFACVVVLILGALTGGLTTKLLFSVYRSSLLNPLTYLRFFTHVLGHASVTHLVNNMMTFLLLGPMLEEKYGSKDLLFVILSTAFVTGLVNFIFFPHVRLLGASGVVFAFILLSSITGIKQKQIPLTFLIVAVLYLGSQIYEGIFVADNVSQLGHILGGIVGAVLGYIGVEKS